MSEPTSSPKSEQAFTRARQVLPGGVNSPVRAFRAVGGNPRFIKSAKGCTVTDIDGQTYIDYVGGYGPMILGHVSERVEVALTKAIGRGTAFGMPTEAESLLAERIIGAMPAIDTVRLVNSGTEATMTALRIARAATGRNIVLKFAGCYHGHHDAMLVQAGSGGATFGVASSAGVNPDTARDTLVARFNDLSSVTRLLEAHDGKVAAIVVEPVAGNMGVVAPADGFLNGLRELSERHGALLIFDEVMSGFRVAPGGAQQRYNVKPDLTCLGKIIGGGLPVGAVGGSRQLMELLSPAGQVYQAGTFSGNPLTTAAGIETLDALTEPGVFESLEARSAALEAGLKAAAEKAAVPIAINRVASMLTVFFVRDEGSRVTDFDTALACDTERFATFFNEMLSCGVMLPPSQFEAWFVSSSHEGEVIGQTIAAAERAFAAVAVG